MDLIEQLEGYATAMMNSYRELDLRRALLEPLVSDETLQEKFRQKFHNTYGGHSFNAIVPILVQDLIRGLFRTILDRDEKAASYVNLYRKASLPENLELLRERFATIPEKFEHRFDTGMGMSDEQREAYLSEWRVTNCSRYKAKFVELWQKVVADREALEASPIAGKIRTYRNKHFAHLIMQPLGEEPKPFDINSLGLTIGDVLDFHHSFADPVADLVRVISRESHSMNLIQRNSDKCATDMWQRLAE